MSRKMLVNVVNEEESRIAIVSDGVLEELSIETAQHEQIESNIYKAKVVKAMASLDAAFVEYGGNRNGFLALSDIHPRYFSGAGRDADSLRKGQELMVQVKKGEIGQKGAALTTYVSLPGRYFVLMPEVNKRGVSRKIDDDGVRDQLREILDGSGIPEEMGYIARTAAAGRTKPELTRDATYLLRLWNEIRSQYDSSRAPALLYQDSDIVIRTIRDYYNPSIDEILVDDREMYEQVHDFFAAVMPRHKGRVTLHQSKAPLFNKYNLEEQISSIYEKTVNLPSGGSIVIEQTEALVSIDVNSGKTVKGRDIEETALLANNEAAEEVARQLRLRDMGGLIVVDFIDMKPSKNRTEVKRTLTKAMKEDKARTEIGTISKFGLLELSRQRIKATAGIGMTRVCPICSGTGKVRSTESMGLWLLRLVQTHLARKVAWTQVLVGASSETALFLLNRKRAKTAELESAFGSEVLIFAEPSLAPNQYYLEFRKGTEREVATNLPDEFPRGTLKAPQGMPGRPVRPPRPPSYAVRVDEEPTPGEENLAEEPAPADGPAVQEQGETPKKRRRRRRRKKSGGDARAAEDRDVSAVDQPAGVELAAAAEPSQTAGPLAPAAEKRPLLQALKVLSASALQGLERLRKGEATPASAGEAQTAEPPAAAPPETEPEGAGSETAGEGEPKPATRPRRPRRRRPKSKTPAGSAEAKADPAARDSEAAPAAAPAPAPAPAPATPVAEAPAAGSEPAPAAPKKRRRSGSSRTRRPNSEGPAAATQGGDPGETATGESVAPPATPKEKTVPAAATTGDAEPADAGNTAPKPARRRRTRRPAAKKTAEGDAAGSADTEPTPVAKAGGDTKDS